MYMLLGLFKRFKNQNGHETNISVFFSSLWHWSCFCCGCCCCCSTHILFVAALVPYELLSNDAICWPCLACNIRFLWCRLLTGWYLHSNGLLFHHSILSACISINLLYFRFKSRRIIRNPTVIAVLVALIMYPLCFSGELSLGNRPIWEFGWAYGVCWGAAIFLFGGVILLLCDKESEEIYFKERKIVHNTQLQT